MEQENVLCIPHKIMGRLFADGGNWNSVYFLCPVLGSTGLYIIAVTENTLDFKLERMVRKS